MIVTQENIEQVFTSSMSKPLFCLFYTDDPTCDTAKNALTTAISDTNEYVTLGLFNLKEEICQGFQKKAPAAFLPPGPFRSNPA